jgi:hypothetical protein
MATELKPPIILLGNTRSGTTIVQNLVATHPGVASWYEPRTLWLYADPGRAHDEFDESDATPRVKRYIRRRFLEFQREQGDRVVMEKTPANILKIPYVHSIFPEATYLFIVRNPFSFISSVESKWRFRPIGKKGTRRRLRSTPVSQWHHYAGRYVRDKYLRRFLKREHLSLWGPRYPGIQRDVKDRDLLTVVARQWSVCSRKAEQALAALGPDRVLRLRYEDFVAEPVAHLERICAHSGLEMSAEMVKAANESVDRDRQHKWRRFEPSELSRIVPEIEDEMRRHGYELPPEIARCVADLSREESGPRLVRPTEARPGASMPLHGNARSVS